MTMMHPAQESAAYAWQTYCQEKATLEADYQTAAARAQTNYAADIKAALDQYHSVERAAWQAWLAGERAAKRRYLEVAGMLGQTDQADPVERRQPPAGPPAQPTYTDPPTRPVFNPNPEMRL